MNYQDYLDTLKNKLSNKAEIRLATEEKLVAYEEEYLTFHFYPGL